MHPANLIDEIYGDVCECHTLFVTHINHFVFVWVIELLIRRAEASSCFFYRIINQAHDGGCCFIHITSRKHDQQLVHMWLMIWIMSKQKIRLIKITREIFIAQPRCCVTLYTWSMLLVICFASSRKLFVNKNNIFSQQPVTFLLSATDNLRWYSIASHRLLAHYRTYWRVFTRSLLLLLLLSPLCTTWANRKAGCIFGSRWTTLNVA